MLADEPDWTAAHDVTSEAVTSLFLVADEPDWTAARDVSSEAVTSLLLVAEEPDWVAVVVFLTVATSRNQSHCHDRTTSYSTPAPEEVLWS